MMAHDELPMYCPDCGFHFDICECEETQIAREWIREAKFKWRLHQIAHCIEWGLSGAAILLFSAWGGWVVMSWLNRFLAGF